MIYFKLNEWFWVRRFILSKTSDFETKDFFWVDQVVSSQKIQFEFNEWFRVKQVISSQTSDFEFNEWFRVLWVISSQKLDFEWTKWFWVKRSTDKKDESSNIRKTAQWTPIDYSDFVIKSIISNMNSNNLFFVMYVNTNFLSIKMR